MNDTLPVVETFHSIQGEGAHSGRSAFFIRLASCNVGCPWCDTKVSWEAAKHPQIEIVKLSKNVFEAKRNGAAFVVITGGEPLHHNLDKLSLEIRKCNPKFSIHVETSGVNKITGDPNWVTLSPKRHAPPRNDVIKACNELKIVIHEKDDLIFAEKMSSLANDLAAHPIHFLQPGWDHPFSKDIVIDYIKQNPKWRLSLQIHKWLKVT